MLENKTSPETSTYKIVRLYNQGERPYRTIKEGISLAEAKAHCLDPRAREGQWIDAFYRENTRPFI